MSQRAVGNACAKISTRAARFASPKSKAEQKEILKIVRRLADEGQIVLGGAGGEEMV
ncbi:MAG: hypothetical protein V5B38_09220 [Candidatus Accumulibacter propinquus]|jgi:flagellar motor switch protein FliG